MSNPAATVIKRLFRFAGVEIRRADHPANLGWNAIRDIANHVRMDGNQGDPTVFDVGANSGQTVANFRASFRHPRIHCFEPGTRAFSFLQKHTLGIPNLTLNNIALGSSIEEKTLLEMEDARADMNSFLEPGPDSGVQVLQRNKVSVSTVDDYCKQKSITRIDVLKSDTQGFDLEVLRGAERMIREGRVRLVYIELNFCKMYENLPPVDLILQFMRDHDFELVSFYKMNYVNNRAGWNDALFVSKLTPMA
jgi:FkbM family methyltransferase